MATRKKPQSNPGLKESAYEVWLAGLGALNVAGEEGSRVFKELVEKGREQEEANKARLSRFTERAVGLTEDAKDVLSKVTSPIEDGLAAAMQRLGMPTRAEIIKLTQRVETLTRIVQETKAKAASHAKPAATAKAKPAAAAKAKPKARAASV